MTQSAPAAAGRAPPGPAAGSGPTPGGAPTDEALMTSYAGGNAAAFEILYHRHKGALYRYFRRQLDEAEAHDCFQTLWLKIIHYQDRYSPSAPFRHYLFTLAHNVLMDHYRDHQRKRLDQHAAPIEPADLPDPLGNPEHRQERAELVAALNQLIRGLPRHQREAWLLRQETSFSIAEIARVTGTSEEGVKSRLRYARDKLRQGMARYVR